MTKNLKFYYRERLVHEEEFKGNTDEAITHSVAVREHHKFDRFTLDFGLNCTYQWFAVNAKQVNPIKWKARLRGIAA